MTLCIAAACQDRGKPRIVIGTDWKVSTITATAEIQDKLYWVNDDIPALIAGTIQRAVELKDTIKSYFDYLAAKKQPIESCKGHQLTDHIRKSVMIFKRKLADEHVSLKLGMGYKEFGKAIGRNQIPISIANETMQEISSLELNCCLILPFFWEGDTKIYKIDTLGGVERCDNFAAIGSGAPIADSVLYQRQLKSSDPLGPSVYHVFEAMKLGSIASDVGQEHTINVLYPPGEKRKDIVGEGLTKKTQEFLERKFRQFGPKPFQRLKLPNNPFEKEL